jgi:cytochrome c biogenesis protein CcmG, thiol:disulfide interchange protein DsbE
LASTGRTTLVHVWATWCPPCRQELPGLLAVPSEYDVDVIAIALDKNWADVDRHLDGLDASGVFLGDSESVKRSLVVSTLPVTFILRQDQVALRFDGARDWTDRAFLKRWLGESTGER